MEYIEKKKEKDVLILEKIVLIQAKKCQICFIQCGM